MKVINLYGGPGSGKSTTAAGVFHTLKLQGVVAELVTEYAKDLTWEMRHDVLRTDQLYIFAKQHRRLWRLRDKGIEVAITDSPILLTLLYRSKNFPESLDSLALDIFNMYDNMNYFLRRVKPYYQVGRIHSEKDAVTLDREIKHVLNYNGIVYSTLNGDEAAVAKIVADYHNAVKYG